ncbi:BatA domain-containing protein [Bradymonas sediminis]|uniref:Uncharacterized protein n=1 Tax=Bradymonas sediminis TaxID=1548548 RepID=A0A2Z4FPN8_9DELT|nr:BatA domain-containing protein [Bradymonas sediminis]AWV90923.1 hypothetical protein DN745_16970 [Bradymonas sediminis]TDP75340.1 putative membrane protein (TIGR02226 family) [Bradymonas sediminis]
MSFLEPLFLAGLLAIGIPIAIHLINRRKATRQPFPAMRLLLESNQKEAPSIKVRQWLLLALRILIVAALAFALAKPYFLSSKGVTASERLPAAVVVVVDDSASMQYGDWWARAEDAFDEQMGELRPWDEVALIRTSSVGKTGGLGPIARFSTDHKGVRNAFTNLKPGDISTDLSQAAVAASDLLAASQLPGKYIVLISDFSLGGFPENPRPESRIPYEIRKVSVRKNKSSAPDNLSVSGVDYVQEHGIDRADIKSENGDSPSGAKFARGTNADIWKITATVTNHSEKDKTGVEIRLNIDGQDVAGGLVDVEAGKSASYEFRHRFEGEGVKKAYVELADADDYAPDNRYYFGISLKDRIRVLLVNGEPSGVAYSDETYFLVRALNPGGRSKSSIIPEVTSPSGLAERDLAEFDVVVLANVARVAPKGADKLKNFVRGGGGLFLTMGGQVDPASWNQNMSELLPKPLRGVKQLAERDDPDAPVKITHLGTRMREHPVFRVFDLAGGASLQSAQVYSYMLLEPSLPDQVRQILAFKDSAPALVERKVGDGRVLLLTTTIDRDWTDLPVRTAYLPLTRRIVQFLARRATSARQDKPVVGHRITLDVSGLVDERAIIHGPNKMRLVMEPVNGEVAFVPEVLGSYEVWADRDGQGDDAKSTEKSANNRLDALAFAVNADPGESQLNALAEDAFDPWTEASAADVAAGDGDSQALKDALGEDERRVNIWPPFLFAITIFLLLESLLGTRRSVLAKIWRLITFQKESEVEV